MITKQLSQLCAVSDCMLFKGRVYEKLDSHPEEHKYRVMFSSNDCDYVEDEHLIQELDAEWEALKDLEEQHQCNAYCKDDKHHG